MFVWPGRPNDEYVCSFEHKSHKLWWNSLVLMNFLLVFENVDWITANSIILFTATLKMYII